MKIGGYKLNKAISAVAAVALVWLACSKEPVDLVSEAGHAPYYMTLESALAAAGTGQYVAVDFYTDW